MQHIEQCLEKYERLRHRQQWWYKPSPTTEVKPEDQMPDCYSTSHSKDLLLICPDGDTLRQRKHDSCLWQEFLFTDPLWKDDGPFYTHTDHSIHCMPETIEHRAIRTKKGSELVSVDEIILFA